MKMHYLMAVLVLSGLSNLAIAQMQNPQQGNNAQGGPGMGQGMGQGGEHRGPPPQAIAACKGQSSGAACSFQGREGRQVSGTCFAPPGDNHPLACRPEHMGGQGKGGPGMGGSGGGQGRNQQGNQGGNTQ